jgi:flagellar biosynthesis protein FlhF
LRRRDRAAFIHDKDVMEAKTYRARSMQEALELVRRELGPDAALLHTREVRGGLFGLLGQRRIEVVAASAVNVPSRWPDTSPVESDWNREPQLDDAAAEAPAAAAAFRGSRFDDAVGEDDRFENHSDRIPPADGQDYRARYRASLKGQLSDLDAMLVELDAKRGSENSRMPEALFQLFTGLLDAELSEELARELLERVRVGASPDDLEDPLLLKSRLARLVEEDITACGPIRVTPGRRRLAALVGPTGVGKTTTIAKLAANFRLREHVRVGLITVDTYRIAAVEQLRTYADIIDLPMEVVSTPREMRSAVQRLSGMDLILLDTAGRSPRDDVRIQELKSILHEAQPDEVHLVLSGVAGAAVLKRTAEQFRDVGVTALVLTKLDETSGLGNLLPLLRDSRLPLSYVTNGQNVPDDIAPADRRKLARTMLGG